MVNVKEVPAEALISEIVNEFKSRNVEIPEWTKFLKDGKGKEKSWTQPDWYYTRLASILRKIYIKGNIGISRMSQEYGSRQDRGTKRYHPVQSSRFIIRYMFHALETMGYVKKDKAGRVLTPAGQALLDKASRDAMKKAVENNKVLEKYL
ncbi:30S ribosomal protein S19e [Acidiplasma sp.]|uniref:30S ribosomal protein S19e n=1 Tax=Acidiplasma sp. TaxID=1872114 RepID=UPI002590950B|nr:30S ribosomal protein S19e [Acidiplasma sp.]